MKRKAVVCLAYLIGVAVGVGLCVNSLNNKNVVNMDDIVKVETTETGVYLTMEDGTGYYWEGDVEQSAISDFRTDRGYETACNFMDQIWDWNTDGEELSVVTIDGYELYTYKDEDVD